jgi:virginiamycin B lyase
MAPGVVPPGPRAGKLRPAANKALLIHRPTISEEESLLRPARILLAFLTVGLLAACGGYGGVVTSATPTPFPTLAPRVTAEYKIPTVKSQPEGIVLGADGNLWFTEFAASKIGQLNTAGKISENVTPSSKSTPNGIASGPGPSLNLWFTETNVSKVGQITILGPPYNEYTLPDTTARPVGIALGGDGNMWMTDPGTNSIWRVQQIKKKPFVKFTQYHLTGNAQPLAITNGPDGALWFTEPGTNHIGRLPIGGGSLTEYKIPTPGSMPVGIAPGTDNALWFTEQKGRKIGRLAITGKVIAEYPLNGAMTPDALVQGIDGNFYFTDTALNKIGQFFPRSHRTRFYGIPTANSAPTALTLGQDSEVYFVETVGNKLAQFRYFNV